MTHQELKEIIEASGSKAYVYKGIKITIDGDDWLRLCQADGDQSKGLLLNPYDVSHCMGFGSTINIMDLARIVEVVIDLFKLTEEDGTLEDKPEPKIDMVGPSGDEKYQALVNLLRDTENNKFIAEGMNQAYEKILMGRDLTVGK